MEDREIVDLLFARSEQAVAELEQKYGGTVRKTAANLLSDPLDVEECANDTWFGVWNTIPPQRPQPLVSYICRIARNLAVKRYRANTAAKRKRGYELVLDELEECIPSGMNVETELEARELTAAIDRFLHTLSYEDRFLFVRRYFYADAVSELATVTHRSADRTSVRLFQLRERLRKMLEKEGLAV